MTNTRDFEVIIIGGSYAGLSAAMALGRSLRHVLIIDGGQPCNGQTPHSHNFLTQDGKTPKEILNTALEQVKKYHSIEFYSGFAIEGVQTENGFEITSEAKDKFTARKLIFASGIKDLMPDIKGFAECWGISVIHCPYCHGYEFRNQNTALLANGAKAIHLASLINNLTNKLSIVTNGKADFDIGQTEKLKKHNIKIIEQDVQEIIHHRGVIQRIVFKDASKISFDAAYAAIAFSQHSEIPKSLGCEFAEHGYIKVDDFQKTNIEGVYACGDNSSMMRSVANSVYRGNLTGAIVNSQLTDEKF